jgi:hypothetical protein
MAASGEAHVVSSTSLPPFVVADHTPYELRMIELQSVGQVVLAGRQRAQMMRQRCVNGSSNGAAASGSQSTASLDLWCLCKLRCSFAWLHGCRDESLECFTLLLVQSIVAPPSI